MSAPRPDLAVIDAAIRAHVQKSLLRFNTCGSVDDGKSTLIGRLLYESKALFDDQLAALEADSKRVGTRPGEKGGWVENLSFPWVFLNRQRVQSRGLDPVDVAEALAGHLRTLPAVQAVYTRRQLDGNIPADDAIGRRMQKAFNRDRCGELGIVTKPYWLLSTTLTGTIHGTPHPYDTHVPLVVFGPGLTCGRLPAYRGIRVEDRRRRAPRVRPDAGVAVRRSVVESAGVRRAHVLPGSRRQAPAPGCGAWRAPGAAWWPRGWRGRRGRSRAG